MYSEQRFLCSNAFSLDELDDPGTASMSTSICEVRVRHQLADPGTRSNAFSIYELEIHDQGSVSWSQRPYAQVARYSTWESFRDLNRSEIRRRYLLTSYSKEELVERIISSRHSGLANDNLVDAEDSAKLL